MCRCRWWLKTGAGIFAKDKKNIRAFGRRRDFLTIHRISISIKRQKPSISQCQQLMQQWWFCNLGEGGAGRVTCSAFWVVELKWLTWNLGTQVTHESRNPTSSCRSPPTLLIFVCHGMLGQDYENRSKCVCTVTLKSYVYPKAVFWKICDITSVNFRCNLFFVFELEQITAMHCVRTGCFALLGSLQSWLKWPGIAIAIGRPCLRQEGFSTHWGATHWGSYPRYPHAGRNLKQSMSDPIDESSPCPRVIKDDLQTCRVQ